MIIIIMIPISPYNKAIHKTSTYLKNDNDYNDNDYIDNDDNNTPVNTNNNNVAT